MPSEEFSVGERSGGAGTRRVDVPELIRLIGGKERQAVHQQRGASQLHRPHKFGASASRDVNTGLLKIVGRVDRDELIGLRQLCVGVNDCIGDRNTTNDEGDRCRGGLNWCAARPSSDAVSLVSATPISSRRRIIPSRKRVFTVPTGTSKIVATSV